MKCRKLILNLGMNKKCHCPTGQQNKSFQRSVIRNNNSRAASFRLKPSSKFSLFYTNRLSHASMASNGSLSSSLKLNLWCMSMFQLKLLQDSLSTAHDLSSKYSFHELPSRQSQRGKVHNNQICHHRSFLFFNHQARKKEDLNKDADRKFPFASSFSCSLNIHE